MACGVSANLLKLCGISTEKCLKVSPKVFCKGVEAVKWLIGDARIPTRVAATSNRPQIVLMINRKVAVVIAHHTKRPTKMEFETPNTMNVIATREITAATLPGIGQSEREAVRTENGREDLGTFAEDVCSWLHSMRLATRAFSVALIASDLAGSGSMFNSHSSLRRLRATIPSTPTPAASVADSAEFPQSPHPANTPP